jgi:hypothetical protein
MVAFNGDAMFGYFLRPRFTSLRRRFTFLEVLIEELCLAELRSCSELGQTFLGHLSNSRILT